MANPVPSVASAIKLAVTDLHQVPSVTSAIKCWPHGRGERVLVADDEEPLVRLADRNLRALDYTPVPFGRLNSIAVTWRTRTSGSP